MLIISMPQGPGARYKPTIFDRTAYANTVYTLSFCQRRASVAKQARPHGKHSHIHIKWRSSHLQGLITYRTHRDLFGTNRPSHTDDAWLPCPHEFAFVHQLKSDAHRPLWDSAAVHTEITKTSPWKVSRGHTAPGTPLLSKNAQCCQSASTAGCVCTQMPDIQYTRECL